MIVTIIVRAVVRAMLVIIVMIVMIVQHQKLYDNKSNNKILRLPSIQRPRHNDEVFDRLSDRVTADRP